MGKALIHKEIILDIIQALANEAQYALREWKKSMSARNRARIRSNVKEIIALTDMCALKYDSLKQAQAALEAEQGPMELPLE